MKYSMKEMITPSDDVPSTIICHFSDELEQIENDDDIMMDVIETSASLNRSSSFDAYDTSDSKSANINIDIGSDDNHVTEQDLCAMKDMVASMRKNPELLNISPVMQKACLISSSQHRVSSNTSPPSLVGSDNVKNEDLSAMKEMIASMRKNPELLYKSSVMQKACFDTASHTGDVSRFNSPFEDQAKTVKTKRRPLGTKLDPSRIPSLPFSSIPRSVSIGDNEANVGAAEQPSTIKMDIHVVLSRVRPRSI